MYMQKFSPEDHGALYVAASGYLRCDKEYIAGSGASDNPYLADAWAQMRDEYVEKMLDTLAGILGRQIAADVARVTAELQEKRDEGECPVHGSACHRVWHKEGAR